MARIPRTLAAASIVFVICSGSAFADGDAVRGEQLFNRCTACHSVEGQNKAGPALNGVFGRKAGAVEGYRYSPAIENSDVVWTDETLDTYLTAPARMLRGTRMTTGVARPDDRADIIAYLKTLAAP
ncbi:c-type cytochrome [Chelativorans salis]|uniref:Cytochrome c family protein n=1 Tax=Chelativorans salis TaxID=2978478 RepID=A0ABT2LTM2_9HYPH|nr:cytochrome c family protein [Chelativorans sp. EGI FJ00035]MCT7377886.1 cytochrome c family protein [Chelativorans sp. EGI FJ00035]